MGEEKWIRRKPGRVSGTVVPPPAGDELPPLPQRRGAARSRHRSDAFANGGLAAPPVVPDNVRPLFRPVLQPRGARRPRVGAVAPNPARSAGEPYDRLEAAAGTVGTLVATPDPLQARPGATPQGKEPARYAGGAGRRHVAWLAALTLLLLLTATGTGVALLGPGSQSPEHRPVGGEVLAGAAAARAQAATWVSREVSRSAIVGCDAVMCGLLVKAGVPASDLTLIKPSREDPLGIDVIVATPLLQNQFGTRLSTEYAPAILARFGTGDVRVDVRVIAAYGADAYQQALTRDITARELQGTQIVGNSRIALPSTAKTELAAGQVDPRLLITLPALAHKIPVRVLAFYNRGPHASSGVPLSGVKLAGSDPQAGLPAHAYLHRLVSFLHSQRSLYRAASVRTAWRHGRAVVFIRFALPNHFGLLN